MQLHSNNFDFLRLIAAFLIVVAHSYVLSGDTVQNEWIYEYTNGQIEYSHIGLGSFFIISGYLIFQSLERSKTIISYLWKRILRLFPALIVVLLLTVLLAPLVYESTTPFLKNSSVYYYFPRNISLYHLKYNIKGVFENNPYPKAINGSLWTICYEFTLYLFIIPLFFIHKKVIKKILVAIVFLGLLFAVFANTKLLDFLNFYTFEMKYFFNFAVFFMAGALLSLIGIENFKYKGALLIVVLIALVLSVYFNFFNELKYILLSLLVILLGIQSFYPINQIHRVGDFSYGIYIYSFPIQQTLMHFYKLNTGMLLLYSTLLSLLFGILSWHLVEKYALRFKNKI